VRITSHTTAAQLAPLVYEAAALLNRLAPVDRTLAPSKLYSKAYHRFLRRLKVHGELVRTPFEIQTGKARLPVELPFEIQTGQEGEESPDYVNCWDCEGSGLCECLYDEKADPECPRCEGSGLCLNCHATGATPNSLFEFQTGDEECEFIECPGCDASGDCYCVEHPAPGIRVTDPKCYDCGGSGSCRSCHGGGLKDL
jgi:hypothetical protein